MFSEKDEVMISVILDVLRRVARITKTRPLTNTEFKGYSRVIGNTIFEMKPRYSGFTSEAALLAKFNDKEFLWCNDHMIPRQVAGETLVNGVISLSRVDESRLREDLWKFTAVNRVTSAENMKLMVIQKKDGFVSVERLYNEAGIKLREFAMRTRISNLPEIYPDLF